MELEEINPMDLLAPDIYINETDPLMTYNPTEINHNNDVQEIIDVDDESDGSPIAINGFSSDNIDKFFKLGQIPDAYSEEEQQAYSIMFAKGTQAVEFYRLHCTACNAHLGSAPYNQDDRYIHPLLKVLICKDCFEFYGSGDFEKDDDGSELYCRWCGQGGKVLCCAQCPFVFCQKCIRVNQGKKMLDIVLKSEDWLCFVCNSKQIIRYRITCRALYEYVRKQLSTWSPLNRSDILNVDKSLCCKGKVLNTSKRKSVDEVSKVDTEKPKKKKVSFNTSPKATTSKKTIAKKSNTPNKGLNTMPDAWETRPEDEVVCTPDLLMIMNFDDHVESTPIEDGQPEMAPQPTESNLNVSKEKLPATKGKSQNAKKNKATPKSKTVPIKNYPALKNLLTNKNKQRGFNDLKSLPSLYPGLSYKWFGKTAEATAKINQNLTSKICSLSKEQGSISTIEDLTKVHNNFQDVLGKIIQSLVKVRKTLRADFIAEIRNLKFMETDENSKSPEVIEDDNDVIIIDSNPTESLPVNNRSEEKAKEQVKTAEYIRVKRPSELLALPVIPIEDTSSNHVVTNPVVTDNAETLVNVQSNDSAVNELTETVNSNTSTEKTSVKVDDESVKNINCSIPEDFVKRMASVKVILDKKLECSAVQPHSCKEYTLFKVNADKDTKNCVTEDQVSNEPKEQINGIECDHIILD